MPTKERYRKLVLAGNKCSRCSKQRDDKNFVECSDCRSRAKKEKENKQLRAGAMALFGIKR